MMTMFSYKLLLLSTCLSDGWVMTHIVQLLARGWPAKNAQFPNANANLRWPVSHKHEHTATLLQEGSACVAHTFVSQRHTTGKEDRHTRVVGGGEGRVVGGAQVLWRS